MKVSDRAAPIAVIFYNFDRDTTNGIKGLRYMVDVRSVLAERAFEVDLGARYAVSITDS